MNEQEQEQARERYPWAGPALFITMLGAVGAFFWWLL